MRTSGFWFAVTAGWLSLAHAAPSATFGAPQQLGYAAGDDWEPTVAVDGLHVYAFWMHFGSPPDDCSLSAPSHMVFQASADGGVTWGPPHSIFCQAQFQADAQLVVSGHRLYASWMNSKQNNSSIWVAFSDNFGATWKGPYLATRNDNGGSGGDKDILVAQGGAVWVTWEHATTNTVAYTPDIETQPFALINVPNPNGLVSLATGGGLDTHGNLYFTWAGVAKQGQAKGPTTLFLGRSADRGAHWKISTIAVSAAAPAPSGVGWDFFGASAALAILPRPGQPTDRLVAVYNKGLVDGGAERIFTAHSDDQGLTWVGQEELSSAPQGAFHGFTAAVADGGGVRVTWMDNRANPVCSSSTSCGTWNVWYRSSTDGASDWSSEQPIDPAPGFGFPFGDYQWLALDAAGNSYAIWGAGSSYDGPGNIWFSRTN